MNNKPINKEYRVSLTSKLDNTKQDYPFGSDDAALKAAKELADNEQIKVVVSQYNNNKWEVMATYGA